jgi:uncharacterized membrane protein YphA (DoxX/SURF4 family)
MTSNGNNWSGGRGGDLMSFTDLSMRVRTARRSRRAQRTLESHRGSDAVSSAIVLFPIRLFLVAGWLRAGAEKIISPAWWRGDTLRSFLDAQHDAALPYFQPVMEHVIAPFAVEVAAIVAVAQILIGLAILVGRPLRVALWCGVVLNVVFVLAGRVNPSAFYLVMEAALLYAVSVGLLADRRTEPSTRTLVLVVGWLALAAVNVPFITTIEPAKVIEDPAMMLTFLGVVVATTSLLRWVYDRRWAFRIVVGSDLEPLWSWLLCRRRSGVVAVSGETVTSFAEGDSAGENALTWAAPELVDSTPRP